MIRKKDILEFVIILLILFIVGLFVGSVSPLVFFFLWIICPCLAYGLRSSSLDKSMTSRGYYNVRVILVIIAVVISFINFGHYGHFRNKLGNKYIDGYSVHYYVDTDEYGRRHHDADASANNFSGEVILYLSQWVWIGMCIFIPISTWKIASKSIQIYEIRERESNNSVDSDDV